jgi:hypothetical protein
MATHPHHVTPPHHPILHIVSCINYPDIKWFRLEKYYTGSDSTFMEQPLFYQYLYILLLCIIGQSWCYLLPYITWSTHIHYLLLPPKRICRFSSRSSHRCSMAVPRTKIPEHKVPLYRFLVTAWLASTNLFTRHNYITMALIVSSFGKMLLILMVIWDYKQLEYSWLVSIIVLTSNIEALSGKSS